VRGAAWSSGWGWVEEVVFVAAEEEREAAEVVVEVWMS
jgi:hypothetical protein